MSEQLPQWTKTLYEGFEEESLARYRKAGGKHGDAFLHGFAEGWGSENVANDHTLKVWPNEFSVEEVNAILSTLRGALDESRVWITVGALRSWLMSAREALADRSGTGEARP